MSPSLLFVLCLFLSFGLYTQGYRLPSFGIGTEHERCIDRCHDTEEEFSGLLSCLSDCQRKYGEEEWGQQGREPKSPQEEFEQCQEQCQREERGDRQQQQRCQRRCEEKLREREREQEQEREKQREGREHQQGGRGEDPQQQYRQCLQRCQKQEQGPQQERCQSRCEEKLREQKEQEERQQREGGRGEDPQQQYKQCQQRCQRQEQGQQEQERCQSRCKEQLREQEEQQEREKQREEREHQQGGRGEDPQQQYKQCQQRCQRQEQGQQQQERCQRRCDEQLREQQEQEERDLKQQFHQCQLKCEEKEQSQQGQRQCQQRCEQQYREKQREQGRERNAQRDSKRSEEEQERTNPYYFHTQKFQSRFRTQEGHLRVLQRFTEKSQLLRGIENYRLAIFEANPNTFVVPHHRDADSVFVVLNGKGTISFVLQENRESFNLEHGDVIRVPAGTTVYLINNDNNEKLQIAHLIHSVNTPGQFKDYFAVGSENPESYYRVFSDEVLKTALNTPRDQLDRFFGQQRQGFIIRATQEQLQPLSQHASSARQRGRSDRGPFNLLKERHIYSNRFGQFFEASPNDFKQLQDLNVSVSFADIKQGAIMMPHYSSRTTTLFLVFEGSGRFEMACPHLSSQSQESQGRREQREKKQEEDERSGQYQKISTHVSPGDVLVVPADHPVAIVASQNENLRAVGFGINAQNNKRNFLAGRDNIMNQMEREAKELSFNVPAELVEQIFNNQRDSHFAAAGTQQGQQRKEGRGHSLASILDFVEMF